MGSIIDGMDEDYAYINTTNSAGASWYGFYDEGIGISSYEYALGTANDIESVISFTPAGLQNSIMLEGLSLAHGSSYVFSVMAIDSMDNRSDTASSNGFTVDLYPGPPQISSLSLDTLSIISSTLDTVIEVFFTEPIIGPNVALNGILQESYPSSATYFNNPPKLFITLDAPFISMDTLIININNISDLAGINGSDMSLTYYAGLLADYNKDEVVDVLDLAKFIQSWNADDYSFELGPAIGMVPYLKPNPDNEFTIRDAMTFSRMWYWSNSTSMNALASGTNIGSSIEIYQTGTRILIVPPHESIASEIAIEYPTKSMEFNNNSNNQTLLRCQNIMKRTRYLFTLMD